MTRRNLNVGFSRNTIDPHPHKYTLANMSDLHSVTTDDLINELRNRHSFKFVLYGELTGSNVHGDVEPVFIYNCGPALLLGASQLMMSYAQQEASDWLGYDDEDEYDLEDEDEDEDDDD